jgi:hypothetical protein
MKKKKHTKTNPNNSEKKHEAYYLINYLSITIRAAAAGGIEENK